MSKATSRLSIGPGSMAWRLTVVKGLGRLEVAELLEHPPLAP
jgi:hypothetical protein